MSEQDSLDRKNTTADGYALVDSKWNVLIDRLKNIVGITSVCVNINPERTNVILGPKTICLLGKPAIEDTLCGITFSISAESFYQVNPIQAERLYDTAISYAGLQGGETVWDLYCGIGTISLAVAKELKRLREPCGQVYGVEIVPQAIEDAIENAKRNQIDNAHFTCGKAEDFADLSQPDIIVVDPPRKGLAQETLNIILQKKPKTLVYVSCDPATLARDLRLLADGGYTLRKVRSVDMFGFSTHVETVCLLSKLNTKQHIEVDIHMDELDLTDAKKKATYREIKDYVLECTGLKVSSLYIAQVKQKFSIIERENFNKTKSEEARVPQCPADKEQAIKEALKHFGMI